MAHLTFYGTIGMEMELTLVPEEFDNHFVNVETILLRNILETWPWR